MSKTLASFIVLLFFLAGVLYIWNGGALPSPILSTPSTGSGQETPTPSTTPVPDNMIRVFAPKPGDTIKSPLHIEGEARGNWYFEASFPAEILDSNGNQLAMVPIQAKGEWMTTEFVTFSSDITFKTPATESGTLILHKDNPSGLPQNDDERRIPIKFDLSLVPKRTIKLYYYNPEKDKDSSGNVMCTAKGLEPLERSVPLTISPVQDAVKLLLKGILTDAERARGITTEFPLPGLSLISASLASGSLTMTFADPQNKTGGGSCRATMLWLQIEATAKQFSGVKTVKFLPEELFQP